MWYLFIFTQFKLVGKGQDNVRIVTLLLSTFDQVIVEVRGSLGDDTTVGYLSISCNLN